MDINNLQRTPSHSYRVDADRVKHLQQAYKNSTTDRQQSDAAIISEEGRNALKEKMSEIGKLRQTEDIKKLMPLYSGVYEYGIMNDFEKIMSELGNGSVSDDFVTNDYSQASVDALKARFEENEGTRTDTFDSYVNKMASAYQLMKDRIEEKYAAPDREKEYYIEMDGSAQEMTKEKELEMLDKAYETHSRFMAVSTQIWSELSRFKAQIVYHSGAAETEAPAAKNRSTGVKEHAYSAFMSAINKENSGLLRHEKGNLNQLRLNLGISSSARANLNRIWDYYANLKR